MLVFSGPQRLDFAAICTKSWYHYIREHVPFSGETTHMEARTTTLRADILHTECGTCGCETFDECDRDGQAGYECRMGCGEFIALVDDEGQPLEHQGHTTTPDQCPHCEQAVEHDAWYRVLITGAREARVLMAELECPRCHDRFVIPDLINAEVMFDFRDQCQSCYQPHVDCTCLGGAP